MFRGLKALGGTPSYTVVVGCEVGNVDEGIGLTEAVASAVPRAIDAVQEVVAGLEPITGGVGGRAGLTDVLWAYRAKWSACWTVTRGNLHWSTSPENNATSMSACCPRRRLHPATE